MSMYPSNSQGRRRRSGLNRTQQLYEARSLPIDAYDEAIEPDGQLVYAPNEPYASDDAYEACEPASGDAPDAQPVYAPNEPYEAQEAYDADQSEAEPEAEAVDEQADLTAPSVPSYEGAALPTHDQLSANLSAYYRRPAAVDPMADAAAGEHDEYAYAPPSRTDLYRGLEWDDAGENEQQDALSHGNVYHPRAADWARSSPQGDERPAGYQVQEDQEEPVRRRRRKRRTRRMVALLAVLALLGGGAYAVRDKLGEWIGALSGNSPAASAPPAAITTPAPARGYDAATPFKMTDRTGKAISDLSGTLDMEPYLITQESIMTRSVRPDGMYDYYLFGASDGRLLAYFEGLGERDAFPLPDGGFYIRQEPYLVADDGSAMVKNAEYDRALGEAAVLHPMMNGFALVSDQSGSTFNYVGSDGMLLSRLWFARAFPMTGALSVAYVDTGNVTDTENRYSLYVLGGENAAMNKWFDAGDMTDVVASACGMAYMNTGELYSLESLDKPLLTTDDLSVYVDCDALVAREPSSGKYGLLVHGERHYDFVYDSITPVECDMVWEKHAYEGAGGNAALYNVVDAAYPQPLSHYFRLLRDGREEFVALSTSSGCPVLLD